MIQITRVSGRQITHMLDCLVTDRVTMTVVDAFKVIDIKINKAEKLLFRLGPAEAVGGQLVKVVTV